MMFGFVSVFESTVFITETSPYKSGPRFPPNITYIVKMGEIWGRNQNDNNG